MKCSCVAYQADGESVRFYIHQAPSFANAVGQARREARRLGKDRVFVESETGAETFDGKA